MITPCDIEKSHSNQQKDNEAVEVTDDDEVASEPSCNSHDNVSNDEESQATEHNNDEVGHNYITPQDSNGKSCNTEASEVVANDSQTSVELEVN